MTTLTEQEAREKWCPFARSVWAYSDPQNGIFATANRGQTDDPCRCVASGCMAWRWVGGSPIATIEPVQTSASTDVRYEPNVGHCGLAGKP